MTVLGELFDLLWYPAEAEAIGYMYRGRIGGSCCGHTPPQIDEVPVGKAHTSMVTYLDIAIHNQCT
jgi:hypothetical protein